MAISLEEDWGEQSLLDMVNVQTYYRNVIPDLI